MRIAMILSTPLPPREGIGFYAWNLARHLTRQGHQVHLVTRGWLRLSPPQVLDGITIWRPFFLPLYPFHVHLHGLFVNALVRRLDPQVDLYHLHTPLVPYFSTIRPVLVTFHSELIEDAKNTPLRNLYTLLIKLQSPVSYQLESENIKRATFVNAVSPQVAQAIQKYHDVPAKIEIMWNGVDTNIFKPGDQKDRYEKTVLSVGRLAPGKGLEDLIEAAELVLKQDPEVRFLIAGEGNLRASLEKLIQKKSLMHAIQMIGHISNRDEIISLYQKVSVFVLPSYHEGMPTVLLEAMACGCPVLATQVGGIPDMIKNGENGLLIPPRNILELSCGITKLLENSQLSRNLGIKARQTIEENFSWERIGSQYLRQYRSMVQ